MAKNVRNQAQRKLDIRKLRTTEVADAYLNHLTQLLRNAPTTDNITSQWQYIADSIERTARSVLGYSKPSQEDAWYDDKCRNATRETDAAYREKGKEELNKRQDECTELFRSRGEAPKKS